MKALIALVMLFVSMAQPVSAQAPPSEIGIVIMHGKGGAPTKLVAGLAKALSSSGYQVANLEMPWSGQRNYDKSVKDGVAEVDAALASLRARGARKLFVCGHSLGGLFALYYAGQRRFDGLILIAPGGDPGSEFFRGKLGPAVDRARKMIADGKGNERSSFDDFENAKGLFSIETTAASYLSWFDPDGAMNQTAATGAVDAAIPVLYVVPTNDYPGLLRAKDFFFPRMPRNPGTRLYQPSATHTTAPWESREEIMRWIGEVAR
jgi:alpha-beta hydrolase superfamily lysophospholipase